MARRCAGPKHPISPLKPSLAYRSTRRSSFAATWGTWNPLADFCSTTGEQLLDRGPCWTVSRWGRLRAGCLAPGSGLRELPGARQPARRRPSRPFRSAGLIIINVMGPLLLRPWKLCILLWSASDTLSGPGRGAWFRKFAKPTSETKHPAPALARTLFR